MADGFKSSDDDKMKLTHLIIIKDKTDTSGERAPFEHDLGGVACSALHRCTPATHVAAFTNKHAVPSTVCATSAFLLPWVGDQAHHCWCF